MKWWIIKLFGKPKIGVAGYAYQVSVTQPEKSWKIAMYWYWTFRGKQYFERWFDDHSK